MLRFITISTAFLLFAGCSSTNQRPANHPKAGEVIATTDTDNKSKPEVSTLPVVPKERSACTPNGLFTASSKSIALKMVCLRVFSGGGESMWFPAPTVINDKQGRYELPFRDAFLVRENSHFMLVAMLHGKPIKQSLHPDKDGIFSFEDVIDYLEEVE